MVVRTGLGQDLNIGEAIGMSVASTVGDALGAAITPGLWTGLMEGYLPWIAGVVLLLLGFSGRQRAAGRFFGGVRHFWARQDLQPLPGIPGTGELCGP